MSDTKKIEAAYQAQINALSRQMRQHERRARESNDPWEIDYSQDIACEIRAQIRAIKEGYNDTVFGQLIG